jgi:MoaA/NifB/PqqE/SkfB family radical SAM enzyme
MYRYEDIVNIHLELTENCQAACPMCPRTGNDLLSMSELKLQDIQKLFPPEFIQRLEHISLCGNYGEPIIATDCLEIVNYFRSHNQQMYIGINSNAGARSKQWWSELASIINKRGTVIFGIDGLQDTNHIYRVNVRWNNVMNNAKSFIEAGGRARWDFIAFEHNEHQIEQARELANQMGFEAFRIKKTYRFGKKFKNLTIKPPKNQPNEKGFVLRNSIEYFDQVEINCQVKPKKEIYITAQGLLFPCCWLGGNVYDEDQFWDFVDREQLNVLNSSIEQVMNTDILNMIERSWTKKTIAEGKLLTCAKFCGKNNNLWESQLQ